MIKTPGILLRAALSAAGAGLLSTHAQAEDNAGNGLVIAPHAWALDVSRTVGLNGLAVPLDLQSSASHFETETTGSGLAMDIKGFGPLVGLQATF